MKFFAALFLAFILSFVFIYPSVSANNSYAKDLANAEKIKDALQKNDRATIADMIDYPATFKNELLMNRQDFLQNWDYFFDADIIAKIVASKADASDDFGGVSLENGHEYYIWLKHGRIDRIDTRTPKFAELKAKQDKALQESIATSAETKDDSYAQDYAAAKRVKTALKTNDRATIAKMINYPLKRERPLAVINNSKEFLDNWDDYFDATNIAAIASSEAKDTGWRGVSLGDTGEIWFSEGKIVTINVRSQKYNDHFQKVKTQESAHLYPSAQGYDSLDFECETKAFHIRIQTHKEDTRYFSWKKGVALSTKPELELTNGTGEPDGQLGNFIWTFKKRNYTYELDDNEDGGCEGNGKCKNNLIVTKEAKEILNQVCNGTK